MSRSGDIDVLTASVWTAVLVARKFADREAVVYSEDFAAPPSWVLAVSQTTTGDNTDGTNAARVGRPDESPTAEKSEFVLLVDRADVADLDWHNRMPEPLYPDAAVKTPEYREAKRSRADMCVYLSSLAGNGPSLERTPLFEALAEHLDENRPSKPLPHGDAKTGVMGPAEFPAFEASVCDSVDPFGCLEDP